MLRFKLMAALLLGLLPASLSALTVIPDTDEGGVAPTAVLTVAKGNDVKAGEINAALLDFINQFTSPEFSVIRAGDVYKVDDPVTASGFDFTALDGAPKGESRNFSWSTDDAYQFVVFKAGQGFVAHYYAGGITGNAVTLDKGISHLSFLVPRGYPGIVVSTPVPVPASGLLMLGALVALGARRRWLTR
ncbi:VPLPA-CTERM sorting domain-containing protein [Tropicibacter sp. S64]|uniref:VPLPA-CTERM sorting domain-containing protein n=1 Tax=Tropicibacter sp. S64 TaxID=3415122 RepID=UPI003C7DF601